MVSGSGDWQGEVVAPTFTQYTTTMMSTYLYGADATKALKVYQQHQQVASTDRSMQ